MAGPSAGLLEDYACVAAGLLRLAGVTGEDRWVAVAGALLDSVLSLFGDGNGGFYDTAADGERLIFRPADPTDNATPSGAFAAADALLSYGALTGEARYTEAAVAALRVLPPIADRYPRAGGLGLSVAEALLSGPAEIAIVGPDDDPRTGRPAPGRPARGAAGRGLRPRLGGVGRRRRTRFRCWPAVRWSPARRRRTSAAVSPAWHRLQQRVRCVKLCCRAGRTSNSCGKVALCT